MTNYYLTATPSSAYCRQQQFTVQWSIVEGTPKATDYVAMYAVNGHTELWRQTTGGSISGDADVPAPTPSSSYEFRYFDGTTNNMMARSNSVVAEYPPIDVAVQVRTCQPYEPISVFCQTVSPDPRDTLGLYAVGAPSGEPIWEAPLTGEIDGTYYLNAPATPGQYEFRYYWAPADYTVTSTAITVEVNSVYSVTATLEPGTMQVNVGWNTHTAGSADTIGLYLASDPYDTSPRQEKSTQSYMAGTTSFTLPDGQLYQARYLQSGAIAEAYSAPFTVASEEPPTATLTASPRSVASGDPVTVTWSASAPANGDLIGLFLVGAPDAAPQTTYDTGGNDSGTLTPTAPTDAGDYEYRYLAGGTTAIGTSNSIMVSASAPRAATLSVTPNTVAPNVAVTVSWDSPDAAANDWVGMFAVTDRDATPLASLPIGSGTSGTLLFTAPAQEGHYQFRYFAYGTSTPAARSNLLTVLTSQVSIAATPGSVPSGAEIAVAWDAFNGSINDRVGLFAVDADDASPLTTQRTGIAPAGRLTFIAPDQFTEPETTGQYEFRYFFAGSDVAAARSNAITVTLRRITLSAVPTTVVPGGALTVTWNATNTTSSDEVGLYRLSDSDVSPISYQSTGGAASGEFPFTAPVDDGEYAFRYLLGGTTAVAHGDVISVYGGEPPDTTVAHSLPDAVVRGHLEQLIINQSIHDAEWRALLISDPVAALTDLFGNAPPTGLTINVSIEDAMHFYHVVPDTTGEVVPSEDDWVLHPVLSPGELESDGVLDGSEQLPDLSDAGPEAQTIEDEVEAAEDDKRGLSEIMGGLATLDESVGTVAVVSVAPMALTSRRMFKGQLNYLLMTDGDFYSAFTADPTAALAQQFNFRFPEAITLTPLVETGGAVHIVLPYAPHGAIFNPPYAAEFLAGSGGTIEIPVSDSLTIQDAITVEAWFKATAFHGDTDDVIASTHQSDGGWELRVGGGVPRFIVNLGGTDYVAQPGNPLPRLKVGIWYYLAGVYDGQQVQLYLNDVVLTPPTAATGTIGANADNLTLGRSPGAPEGQSGFEGLIFDVRVWSGALNADDIRSDFLSRRSETPTPEGALRAWYPMVEGAGTTLYDHSGNLNDGTLNQVTWISTYPDTPNQ
ncbi:MAG TPA: LamG-like jellyroll fold domain-containing protein [Blastocatellia bacterium]|nr:LamG-like jellyroll fold domain-containing protein [Blastocatellia bacterium]